MADHPVKVPPELFAEWLGEAIRRRAKPGTVAEMMANRAAQWAADRELEAIEHWLITGPYGASIAASAPSLVADLRAAMRPKPPTLAEQGLKALGPSVGLRVLTVAEQDDIRAALNRLTELEAQQ